MYYLKPIIQHDIPIDLPATMYTLKSIYGPAETTKAITNGAQANDDWNDLQQRQTALLQQLADLKKLLVKMRKGLGVCAKPAQAPVKLELKPIQTQHLQDVVINASPIQIPYSLIALQVIWQNRLNLIIKCYTHSTVATLPDSARQFAEKLEQTPSDAALPALHVALIWKDVPIIELQCAPATFIPLYGEVNILRYFTRIGPNEFGYESSQSELSVQVDALLDECHQLAVSPAKQRREQHKKLTSKFNSSATVFGDEGRVIDIALFSIGMQLKAPVEADGWKKLALDRLI